MTIKRHITYLLLLSIGGAAAITAAIGFSWHGNILAATTSGRSSQYYVCVENIASSSNNLLAQIDSRITDPAGIQRILGSLEGRLDGEVRQLRRLGVNGSLPNPSQDAASAGDNKALNAFERAYIKAKDQLIIAITKIAELGGETDTPQFLIDHYNEHADAMARAVAALRAHAGRVSARESEALEASKATATRVIAGICLLYVAVIIWLYRWASSRLIRPVQALAESAKQAMECEDAFVLKESGPREVRELTQTIKAFVRSLEEKVVRRTSDLESRSRDLERATLHRQDVQTALLERTRRIELMQGIAVAANAAESVDGALQTALKSICLFLDWPVGHVFVTEEDDDQTIAPTAIWHMQDEQRYEVFRVVTKGMSFKPEMGLVGRAFSYRRPVWENRISEKVDFLRAPAAEVVGLTTAVACPIFVGKEVTAVVELYTDEDVEADPTMLELFENVGTQLGRVVERHRAAKRLREAATAAEAAYKAKSEFIANVSHEIRTPMNGIIGMTELALKTGLTNQQRIQLETVMQCSNSLLTLLNDILDVSKMEAGKLKLEMVSFDLAHLVEEVLVGLGHTASAKRIELIADLPVDLPRQVTSDPTRLRQVLINLIGNAIKFTERGEVVARLRAEQADREGMTLLFEISDTGIGIPEDRRSAIFETFTQADGATTRKYGGTGLGLSICRSILELFQGEIWVQSVVDRGSTFSFRIKVDHAEQDPADATVMRSDRDSAGRFTNQNMVVMDKSATRRRVLRRLLTHGGATTAEFAGEAHCIACLERYQREHRTVDAVVLDGDSCGADMVGLVKRIRGACQSGTKIIFLSHVEDLSRFDVFNTGDCVTAHAKPLRRALLLKTLSMPCSELPCHAFGESARPDVDRPADDDWAGHRVRVLVAEDDPVNRTVARSILQRLDCAIIEVGNGSEAVDAVKYGNIDLVLMDVQMPQMGGLDATRTIRSIPAFEKLPIIAMTAHAQAGDRHKCLAAGMNDYVTKPIGVERFRALIANWAPQVQRQSDAGAAVVNHDGAVTESPVSATRVEQAIDSATRETRALARSLEAIIDPASGSADGMGSIVTSGVAAGDLDAEETINLSENGDVLEEEISTNDITVLVVDDNPTNRALCRGSLKRKGYQVAEAEDGVKALAVMGEALPDVIIMDVMMPNMDGLECTRRLRQDPRTRDIPIIILSARSSEDDILQGLQAGANEYLAKPFRTTELALRVQSMATLNRTRIELLRRNVVIQKSNEVRGEQARGLGILLDYSCSISREKELDTILERTMQAAFELTGCRYASILMPSNDGTELSVMASLGHQVHDVDDLCIPVEGTVTGEVYRSGMPIHFESKEALDDQISALEAALLQDYPAMSRPISTMESVFGVLHLNGRIGHKEFTVRELEYLDLIANLAGATVSDLQNRESRDTARDSIVLALATLAEHRDTDTGAHLDRVTEYALLLARNLQELPEFAETINEQFLADLRRAMPLHDIGKVAIPDAILRKPSRLTDEEMDLMKTHTEHGARAIQLICDRAPGVRFLEMAEEIARSHHEWFDGRGYPAGLCDVEIPLAARLAAVADVYDALTTKRSYKDAFPHEKARAIIMEESGTHFDPQVIEAFLRCEERFAELADTLRDDENAVEMTKST
ncbi:MAG: response regulator [Planctomycetota bacterium]|jgi:response regulator RpfG family c-di-GMP phosphodiesterase/signal transduction histidine kinase